MSPDEIKYHYPEYSAAMRYFMELSYKGTAYNGWQRQDNVPTVQDTIETALSLKLRERIEVVGAGRTDTGVHALYYVVHFDCTAVIDDSEDFIYHLNAILPADIAVRSLTPVGDTAHARFDAFSREYQYYVLPFKSPFRKEFSWQYYVGLDVEKMNEAAQLLTQSEDFTTFSKLHSNNATYLCDVSTAKWEWRGEELVFTIRANRFLRNMVRSIVGTLVDVGRGKMSVGDFGAALDSRDRSRASGSAPAQGLFLTDVIYPEDVFKKAMNETTNII